MAIDSDPSHTVRVVPEQTAAAIDALSARLRAPLSRYFLNNRVPPHEVDDLVQELFLRLSTRAGVESLERLDGYVFTAASNLLRDRRRQMKTHASSAHESYDEGIHGSVRPALEPDRILQSTQLVAKVIAALYELPERTRAVFSLYHFEDLSHAEISEQLGIAISTIEKNMARANAHILKRLER